MPEELRPQIPYIRRAIEGFRIPMIELDRYEADDVMGTLSRKAAAAGLDVILVSADKDLMQLVGDGVAMYHTGRGKLYDAAAVEAELGVPPRQGRRRPGADGRHGGQRPRRPRHRREGGEAARGRVRHGRAAGRARGGDLAQGVPRRAHHPPRPGAALERADDDPHRSADRARARPPAHRGPGRRRAAHALRRARVPAAARGAGREHPGRDRRTCGRARRGDGRRRSDESLGGARPRGHARARARRRARGGRLRGRGGTVPRRPAPRRTARRCRRGAPALLRRGRSRARRPRPEGGAPPRARDGARLLPASST